MQPLRSDAPRSLAIDGHLICVIEHHPRLRSEQPPESIWLFRSGSTWTMLTLGRRETWDEISATPTAATATIVADDHHDVAELETSIERRYGTAAWQDVLDAGHTNEPLLFDRWAIRRIECGLDAASFHRPDLAGLPDVSGRQDLGEQVAAHLERAGFESVTVDQSDNRARPSANPIVARVGAQRLGHDVAITVRMDSAGEVYSRLDRAVRIGERDE